MQFCIAKIVFGFWWALIRIKFYQAWILLRWSRSVTLSEISLKLEIFWQLFDGHEGCAAAIYAKENLLDNILSAIPKNHSREQWLAALPRALVSGFVKTDKEFLDRGMKFLMKILHMYLSCRDLFLTTWTFLLWFLTFCTYHLLREFFLSQMILKWHFPTMLFKLNITFTSVYGHC